jgi:two-component system CheB/CheR fusion protein
VRANAAYQAMFGDAGTDLALQDADGHELPAEATPWRRAARGESFSLEFTLAGEGGARRWFEANGRPIPGNGAGGQGGVVVIRDITERSLQRLQEEFMALASHELRGPLTPLQSYLQLLERRLRDQPVGAPARQYVAIALRQVGRLRRLVDDLLDVTRLRTGRHSLQLAPVRLDELAGQAVELARTVAAEQAEQREQRGQGRRGSPRIELDGEDVPLLVHGDEGRLEQVLLNLLTNALTHAPDTERIAVRLRRDGGPDGQAEVEVQDDGPGIPAADLPHVFTRFYQVARSDRPPRSGLGLGLYIASELVAAHGGAIAVASEEGRGTTFTVRLPLLRDGESPASDA